MEHSVQAADSEISEDSDAKPYAPCAMHLPNVLEIKQNTTASRTRSSAIEGIMLQALQEYRNLIKEVDRRCQHILSRHRDQIVCTRGCAGNCCRIHLSLFPVEAVSLALALAKLAPAERERIQHKASKTNSFGPCPLLEDGACLMYDARAVICRTHGLPMANEYRGRRSVGFCEKNFRNPSPIPKADIIDLNRLNHVLARVNQRFVQAAVPPMSPGHRFTISEALLLNRGASVFYRI